MHLQDIWTDRVIPMDRQGDSYIPKSNVFAGGYNNPLRLSLGSMIVFTYLVDIIIEYPFGFSFDKPNYISECHLL